MVSKIEKDGRYHIVKSLFATGYFKTFEDIFNVIPKTVVAKDLGKNNSLVTELIKDPGGFRIREIIEIAELFEISPLELFTLILLPPSHKNQKASKT